MEQQLTASINFKDRLKTVLEKSKPYLLKGVFSFLISRLIITNGISPFSQAFLLSTGNNYFILLTSILGILSNNKLNQYKYILILLFSSVIQTFLKLTFPNIKKENSAPFILFFSSFVFGLIFVIFTDYVIFDILLVILESFISSVFFFICKNFLWFLENKPAKRYFTYEELTAPLIVFCIIISGIGNIPLPFDLALKNIFCIYVILTASVYANLGTTAQIAVFMGIAAGLGNDYFALFISAFSINSLLTSVFAKHGKLASVLGFTIGNIIISILLTESRYMVISFLDIAVASVLFVLTPEKFLGKFNYFFRAKSKEADNAKVIKNIATVKLDRLSAAFKKLSETISPEKGEKNTLRNYETLYESVSDKVCKKCTMRFYCWQKDYNMTTDAFLKIIDSIIKNGSATVKDFPSYFKQKCIKSGEILNNIQNAYEIFRLNKVWQDRMRENTRIYKDQFNELSDIVSHLKDEIDKNPYFDKNVSTEISSALEANGILVKTVNVLKDCNDSLEIDITLFPCNQIKSKCYDIIADELAEIIGVPFIKSYGKCSFKECHLIFKEAEIFTLECAVRQISKKGNETNGDSWAINTLENGNKYIALCDGSGTGEKANSYSNKTLKLLEEFLKTGFSKASSVKLINSSFLSCDEHDSFSTVDLGIVDLKNGDFEIVKKGAAPTYIMRADGEFDVVKTNTLPIGVFGGEKGKIKKTILNENDLIVMASDGISDALNKEDWIIDALAAIKSDNPEYIAETIMKIAATSDEENDDKTVIVSKLKKIG